MYYKFIIMTQEESYIQWKSEQLEKIEKYSIGRQYVDKRVFKLYSPNRKEICKKCNKEKDCTEFYFRQSKKGMVLQKPCKECCRKYEQDNREIIKSRQIKNKYNITRQEYNKLLEQQEYCCKICKTHKDKLPKELAIDHCHTTGKVRGLLCGSCNTGIGLLKENEDILKQAIIYLNTSKLQHN